MNQQEAYTGPEIKSKSQPLPAFSGWETTDRGSKLNLDPIVFRQISPPGKLTCIDSDSNTGYIFNLLKKYYEDDEDFQKKTTDADRTDYIKNDQLQFINVTTSSGTVFLFSNDKNPTKKNFVIAASKDINDPKKLESVSEFILESSGTREQTITDTPIKKDIEARVEKQPTTQIERQPELVVNLKERRAIIHRQILQLEKFGIPGFNDPEAYSQIDFTSVETDELGPYITFPHSFHETVVPHLRSNLRAKPTFYTTSDLLSKRRANHNYDEDYASLLDNLLLEVAEKRDKILLKNKALRCAWVYEDRPSSIFVRVFLLTGSEETELDYTNSSIGIEFPKFPHEKLELMDPELRQNANNFTELFTSRDWRKISRHKSDNPEYQAERDHVKDKLEIALNPSSFTDLDTTAITMLTKYLQNKIRVTKNRDDQHFFTYTPKDGAKRVEMSDNPKPKDSEFYILVTALAEAFAHFRNLDNRNIYVDPNYPDRSNKLGQIEVSKKYGYPQFMIREQDDFWRVDIQLAGKNGEFLEDYIFTISSDETLAAYDPTKPYNIVDITKKDEPKIIYNGVPIKKEGHRKITPEELFEFFLDEGFDRIHVIDIDPRLQKKLPGSFYILEDSNKTNNKDNIITRKEFLKIFKSFPNLYFKQWGNKKGFDVVDMDNPDINSYTELISMSRAIDPEDAYRSGKLEDLTADESRELHLSRLSRFTDLAWENAFEQAQVDISPITTKDRLQINQELKAITLEKLRLYFESFVEQFDAEIDSLSNSMHDSDQSYLQFLVEKNALPIDLAETDMIRLVALGQLKEKLSELKVAGANITADAHLKALINDEFDPNPNSIDSDFTTDQVEYVKNNIMNWLAEDIFAREYIVQELEAAQAELLSFKTLHQVKQRKPVNLFVAKPRIGKREIVTKAEITISDRISQFILDTLVNFYQDEKDNGVNQLLNLNNISIISTLVREMYIGFLNQSVEEDILKQNMAPRMLAVAEQIATKGWTSAEDENGDRIEINAFSESENDIVFKEMLADLLPANKDSKYKTPEKRFFDLTKNKNRQQKLNALIKANNKILSMLSDTSEDIDVVELDKVLNSNYDTVEKVLLEAYLIRLGFNSVDKHTPKGFSDEPRSIVALLKNLKLAKDQQHTLDRLRTKLGSMMQTAINDSESKEIKSAIHNYDFLDETKLSVSTLPEYWQTAVTSLDYRVESLRQINEYAKKLLVLGVLEGSAQKDSDRINNLMNRHIPWFTKQPTIINFETQTEVEDDPEDPTEEGDLELPESLIDQIKQKILFTNGRENSVAKKQVVLLISLRELLKELDSTYSEHVSQLVSILQDKRINLFEQSEDQIDKFFDDIKVIGDEELSRLNDIIDEKKH